MGEDLNLSDDLDDEEEDTVELSLPSYWRERQRQKLQRKNQAAIDGFLDSGSHIHVTGIMPSYYGELLTWALHQYLERNRWQIASTLGYRGPEPVFTDVDTGNGTHNYLMNGQMLLQHRNDRYVITVDIDPRWRGSIQLEGPEAKKEAMEEFINGVFSIAREENFYLGRNIEFSGRIRFLEVKDRTWDSIVLDTEIKTDIVANTVEFLWQSERWLRYGIPAKRGVLLAGEPGTGKTVICKALMAEASGITCITTSGYSLDSNGYLTELYELADDLSPCIVFIEDIDLIGQNRMEFGYQRGSALLSLLSVLDGIEEQDEIVTVATTNCLETLDRALSQRPSRFDRVIRLNRPSLEQREELLSRLCRKIPLATEVQRYIALKTDGCTPAQLQEIVYSLVIKCPAEQDGFTPDKPDIDRAISRINSSNQRRLGFSRNNHNGSRTELVTTVRSG